MKVPVQLVIIQVFLMVVTLVPAQSQRDSIQKEGLLTHCYTQLAGGVKNGEYKLFYKDQLIEKGQFKQGEKVGKWQYFSFNNILEYEYDYDNNLVTRTGGERISDTKRFNTPCFFRGSPLIPYLFMVNNVYYPEGAVDKNLSGRVVLTLKIDKKGEVYGFYISEKLNYVLDKAVKDAAAKMPGDWRFLPATRNGHALMSEYNITIEFEL